MPKSWSLIWLCPALLLAVGCTSVSETHRQINDQNRQAGEILESMAALPEVQQIGSDIRKNSETLEETLLGECEVPQEYSPAVSESLREKAKEEAAFPWWYLGGTVVLGWLSKFGLDRIILRFFPALVGGPLGAALTATFAGLEGVLKTAQARPDKSVNRDEIIKTVSAMHDEEGVKRLVERLLEAKLPKRPTMVEEAVAGPDKPPVA